MMKKILFILCLLGCGFFAKAQTNPFPTTDSLERFINRWIRNSPVEAFQNLRLNTSLIGMLRFIQNSEIGSGLDTAYKLNDSTIRLITHAPDTFDVTLRFTGGGTANANVGLGFRVLKPGTQEIKTLFASNTIFIDSSSNTDGLTFKADTSVLATQYDLTQISGGIGSGDTTYVQKPLVVNSGTNDTLALIYDYGLDIDGDSALIVDSFSIATRPRVQKAVDSLGSILTTKVNISDTATMLNPYLRKADTTAMLTPYLNDVGWGLAKTGKVVRADSSQVASLYNVNNSGKTYPDEKPLGIIYEKSQWSDINADFLPNPTGTNTLSISSGFLNSSAAAFSYNNYVRILPGRPTDMNRWKMTVRFRNTAWSANSFEFGVGIYSAVTHSGASFGYIAFLQTTQSGSGNLFIYDQSGSTQRATGSGTVTYALNDEIELTYTYNDTTLVFTAQNITTGGTLRTATYTFPANMSVILPNNGNWGLFEGNGGTGTHQVRYIKIESLETQNPNLLIIGNSKTKGYYADFYNLRFPSQLNSTYPTTIWNAGSAERLTDMISRLDELTQLNPSQVILADAASNQLRAGTTITETARLYDILVQAFEAGGTPVYHFVLPEDSTGGGLGQTAWNAYLISKYGARVIQEVYDDMSTNNVADAAMINADDVHLSQAGHNQVVASVISSGKISVIDPNRRSPYDAHDDNVKFVGKKLKLNWEVRKRGNYVPRWSTNLDELTVGPMYMDSLDVIISNSTRPAKPLSTMKLSVEGATATYGSQSALMLFDRSTPSNYYSLYPNANTLNFNYTGTDVAYMGTDGRFRIGNGSVVSTTIPSRFQLKGNWSFSNSSPGFTPQISNSDTTDLTFLGGTSLGNMAVNGGFGRYRFIGQSTTNADSVTSWIFGSAPVAGTNMTITTPLLAYFRSGQVVFNDKVSFRNVPTGQGAYTILVKNGTADSSAGQVPASTFATQSALNDTAAAIRSVITTPTPSYEMFYSDNSSTTVGNTTTEATLLGTGTGTAQFTGATAGSVLSLKGNGVLSTAASPGTPVLEFTISNYTLAMNLTGLSGSLTNVFYDYDFEVIPVGIGTSQDAIVHCIVHVNDGTGKIYAYSTRVTGSFTSSGTLSADVTADWDAADVANTLTSYKNVVQIFRK